YTWLLGVSPDMLGMVQVYQQALFFSSSGYSGVPFRGDLLAIAMGFHAVFVLAHTALTDHSSLGFRACFRACVSTVILVWLTYYFNRAHRWNLSSFSFLYAFLLIDLTRYLVAVCRAGRYNGVIITGVTTLSLIVIPNLYVSYRVEVLGRFFNSAP